MDLEWRLQQVQEGGAAARRSGGAADGAPSLARELADALPIAATAPSRAALAALTATHVARNLANTAQVGWVGAHACMCERAVICAHARLLPVNGVCGVCLVYTPLHQGLAERAVLDGWLGGPHSQARLLGCKSCVALWGLGCICGLQTGWSAGERNA